MKEYTDFYQHLLELEEIERILDQTEFELHERQHLIEVVRKAIHIEVMHMILDELSLQEREQLLRILEEQPNDKGILIFLKRSINNVEGRIQGTIQQTVNDYQRILDDHTP